MILHRCVARNKLADKERRSQAGRLVVNNSPTLPGTGHVKTIRLPQFISPPPPSNLWVVQGGNMTIECLATGTNVGVRWTLNSSTIGSTASSQTTNWLHDRQWTGSTTGPGYLSLMDVNPSMAGHYSCVAITTVASDGSSVAAVTSMTQSTTVHVATVPQFIRVPKSQVFPTAKTVRFECEVTGIPSPEIRWLKVIEFFKIFELTSKDRGLDIRIELDRVF